MCKIKNAWTQQRLEYQLRYSKRCEKYEDIMNHKYQNIAESYKDECEGVMHEMSWVLISIFGLTSKEVSEVEKNKGLTNADYESQEVQSILYQMSAQKHYETEEQII